MKRAQLVGVAIAGLCGIGAFVIMKSVVNKPREIQKEVQSNTVKVLVARSDISLGTVTSDSSFRWQEYPDKAAPAGAITCTGASCSMRDHAGGIARVPMMKEEIITRTKLAKPGEGGVLASILPKGRRAISTKITEDTAVGKLILPNDHVDVILIRRVRGRSGQDEHISDTLFQNVRVLAIGQRIELKDGQKQADGNTATLELLPHQAEILARAKSMGEISLTLRSIADFNREGDGPSDANDLKSKNASRGNGVKVMRYGVWSRSSGVN